MVVQGVVTQGVAWARLWLWPWPWLWLWLWPWQEEVREDLKDLEDLNDLEVLEDLKDLEVALEVDLHLKDLVHSY